MKKRDPGFGVGRLAPKGPTALRKQKQRREPFDPRRFILFLPIPKASLA